MENHRNIRYARAERFGQPQVLAFDGDFAPRSRGSVNPQAPSRLEMVLGLAAPLAQSEHCQVLSIATASRTDKRPVMVFLHGGGFVTGGGELPWYDGDSLAAEQDVVVVSVTHRLGALGYWHAPGSTGPSPGMSDQVAALSWVQANIAAFGGDPGNVTVFGQSAGGFSIVAMLAWGHGGTLFRRAILQSGAGGLGRTRAEAEEISAAFVAVLDADPKTVGEADMAAQRRFAFARKQIVDWLPIGPDAPGGSHVDIIAGGTKDDALPFVLITAGVPPTPGAEHRHAAQTEKMNALFVGAAHKLAAETIAANHAAHLYRFDWSAPQSGLGACHCIELPFLLGSEEAWRDAPMLGGLPWAQIDRLGRKMRASWASFARHGDPGPGWQAGETILP